MLRVQLFGSGRIFDDAVEVRLRSREWTLPLLAYLLMHRGEVIPRRRLAFLMWPDESEEDALTKLRQNLHRLSRVLPEAPAGTPWVSGGSHTISWNCSTPFAIDVAEYERLRTETATLEQAVEHYTGDFLAELDEDWIAIERERLRRLYHADLGTLIRKHRSRRSFDRAIHYAGLLLVSDPWHEEALRALLSARYESGDASGALAEFDAFARRLRAEMDAEPMPETLALREAIARGAPISTTLDSAENAAGHYSHTLPFIGRTEDLASLHGRWSRAARGLGGLTFVRGEAGIGKSRIVSELALLAEAEGGRVLLGRTSSPERDPYQCFSSAVRGALPLVAGVALAPPFLAALAELVPELHAYREDIPQPVRLDPQSERARLLDAGAQLLIELARPRPLLLILEDVHRAGVATIDAIAGIVPRISRSPVLVIATCRPEAVDRVRTLRRLLTDAQSSAELLELGPMNADEVRLLVDASGVAERVSSEFVSSLHRRSGGNPLFVTELMRDAERAESGGSAIAIPETVSAMITERVATLAPSSITVADVAAVAGEAFSVELIREVAQLPNRELLDGIDELLDRHLIRETTGRARYDYAFTHHLVHAAIYENVPPDARSRRHRRIARILEAESSAAAGDNDERAREIALHFERGQDASRAAHHYAHAARRAAALYANEEARELVDRALELGAREDRERFDLLLLRSKLSARLGDIAGDDSDVRALEEIARRLDADAIGTALWQRIDLASRRANRDEECEAIERLREHATAIGSDYWLASVDEAQANRAFSDGEFAVAIERAHRARALFERIGDDAGIARVAAFAAHASASIYTSDADAECFASEAVRLAERAGDAEARISALFHAARVACNISFDYDRSRELAGAALALAIEVGDRIHEVRYHEIIGIVLFAEGRYEEAAKQFGVALELCESAGLAEPLPNILGNLGGALVAAGIPTGIPYLARALDEAVRTGATRTAMIAFHNLMDIAWHLGDVALMSSTFERWSTIVHERMGLGWITAFYDLNKGRLSRVRGEFDASARELEKLATNLRGSEAGAEERVWMMLAEVYDELALTYLAGDCLTDARDALDRNADIARRNSRQQWTLLEHHWIDACVHHAQGHVQEAHAALARAHAVYAKRLEKLVDPANRAACEALPMNRALRDALDRDVWPAPNSPCVIALPDFSNVPSSVRAATPVPSAR